MLNRLICCDCVIYFSFILRFLLCGQSSENSFTAPPSPPHREHATIAASPVAMATGTMETDLNDSLNNSAIEAKRARSSSMIDDVHPSVRVAIEVNDLLHSRRFHLQTLISILIYDFLLFFPGGSKGCRTHYSRVK